MQTSHHNQVEMIFLREHSNICLIILHVYMDALGGQQAVNDDVDVADQICCRLLIWQHLFNVKVHKYMLHYTCSSLERINKIQMIQNFTSYKDIAK